MPEPGEKLELGRWIVGRELVDEYLNAVGDSSPIYANIGVAPPMALAARALGALITKLSLPPGTIHASQDLEFKRMVKLGEEVDCVATLSRPMRRGDWEFISAEFTLYGAGNEDVLSGRTAVLVPLKAVTPENPDAR